MAKIAAEEASAEVASFAFHSSGAQGVDKLLGGGFREGRLAEVHGRSGTGKTQLAMQAVAQAAYAGVRTLFIDTEGAFRPERIESLAEARGWPTEGLLQKVLYVRTVSFAEQMETVRGMQKRNSTMDRRLVVIDTLTRDFSLELPGRSNLADRQAALDVHLSEMARDAFLNRRAYLLTNRVTFGPLHDVGIGGRTVEQLVHSSIRLDREGGRIRATLVSTGASELAQVGSRGID